jgi:hypothetical protein
MLTNNIDEVDCLEMAINASFSVQFLIGFFFGS